MRLIDADELLQTVSIKSVFGNEINKMKCGELRKILEMIKDAPTIEPERKKGKWIERESGTEDKEMGFETVIVCTCCDFPATTFYSEDCESRTQIRTDFCPNCGADTRGTE